MNRDLAYNMRLQEVKRIEKDRNEVLLQNLKNRVKNTQTNLEKSVDFLRRDHMIQKRNKKYSLCQNVVNMLFEYSEDIYKQLQLTNK